MRWNARGSAGVPPAKTWHSRGHLPHWEAGEVPQHIVFRLHDSLPSALWERWTAELAPLPLEKRDAQRRKRIEAALDAGHGHCWLRDPAVADVIEQALFIFDGERYRLHAWVIVPNHVHALVTPLHSYGLSAILHSWKSYTAKEANRLLRRDGAFWQEEYFDRAIRNDEHFRSALEYIEHNPVTAGLTPSAEEYSYSSASWQGNAGGTPALPGGPAARRWWHGRDGLAEARGSAATFVAAR